MKKRVEIGNTSEADIFLSIHMNYFEQAKYSGWQTFYNDKIPNSKELAELIQTTLTTNLQVSNDRIPMHIKGAYIMEKVKIPAVIVECGFLSNQAEAIKLQQQEYQNNIAWGIYLGIQKYFTKY